VASTTFKKFSSRGYLKKFKRVLVNTLEISLDWSLPWFMGMPCGGLLIESEPNSYQYLLQSLVLGLHGALAVSSSSTKLDNESMKIPLSLYLDVLIDIFAV